VSELKQRYGQLLRKYIFTMRHWSQTSGGGFVTKHGAVLPNYAHSKERALTELEEGLATYEPNEADYAALKNEFLYSMTGARHAAGSDSWLKRTKIEVDRDF
jgi:hypothetical protein